MSYETACTNIYSQFSDQQPAFPDHPGLTSWTAPFVEHSGLRMEGIHPQPIYIRYQSGIGKKRRISSPTLFSMINIPSRISKFAT